MFRFAKATSSDSIPRRSAGRKPVRTVWRWSRWAPAAEATSREGRIDGRSHGRTDERRAQAHPERAALLPRRLRPRGGRRLAEDQGAAPEAAVSRAVFRVAARAGPDRSLEPRGLEDDGARGALQARARIRGLMCGDWGAQTLGGHQERPARRPF